MEIDIVKELRGFLDENGRIKSCPSKRKKRLFVLYYLAEKFEPGKQYSEKEVNALLDEWALWGDHATLRRDMYDHWLLDRAVDGSSYQKAANPPAIEAALAKIG